MPTKKKAAKKKSRKKVIINAKTDKPVTREEVAKRFEKPKPSKATSFDPKEIEKQKPEPIKYARIYHALNDLASRYVANLKQSGIEARQGKSPFRGYVGIEVDVKMKKQAQERLHL